MKAFLDYLNENSSKEMQIIKYYIQEYPLHSSNTIIFAVNPKWNNRLLLFHISTQKIISVRGAGLGANIVSYFDFYPDTFLRFT